MNRKIFLLILIPALLLIGAYFFIRLSLGATVKRDKEYPLPISKNDSLKGSAKDSSTMDLRPLFIERMQQVVAKTTHNVYQLSVGRMELDVLASTAVLHNVALKWDKEKAALLEKTGMAPKEFYNISFEKLEIKNINIDDALTRKTMDYDLVKLTNPVFEIYPGTGKKAKKTEEDFSKRFLKEMKKLSIKNVVVEGGKIVIHKKGKKNVLNGVAININDVLIDSATRNSADRFLFSKNAEISFRNYKVATGKDQYNLTVDKVKFQAPDRRVTLTGLAFASSLSKKEFSARQKFAKEYFRLSIPAITITGVDWWRMMNDEEVVASQVNIKGANLFVYLDRSLPAKSKMGNFPLQLLMKAPVKVDIDKVQVADLDLSYEEYNPISRQSGTMYMDDINISVANISNMGNKNPVPVRVAAQAMFMHKVPINANFVFDRAQYKNGKFTAHITSNKDFNGSLINSFSVPLGLAKIERGELQKLEAKIAGDELSAAGEVTLLYKDLKLALLEKDSGQKALDKKSVTSFFANTFLLKEANPKEGKEPRIEKAEFKRIPKGGFFMLVWKTMLTGVLKTIGAPAKVANKTVN